MSRLRTRIHPYSQAKILGNDGSAVEAASTRTPSPRRQSIPTPSTVKASASTSSTTILSLPYEVLEQILDLVLMDLASQIPTQTRALTILRIFRGLNTMCKSFNHYINHSSPGLCFNRYGLTSSGSTRGVSYKFDPRRFALTDDGWTWVPVFQYFQRDLVDVMVMHLHYKPRPYRFEVGNFRANPRITEEFLDRCRRWKGGLRSHEQLRKELEEKPPLDFWWEDAEDRFSSPLIERSTLY